MWKSLLGSRLFCFREATGAGILTGMQGRSRSNAGTSRSPCRGNAIGDSLLLCSLCGRIVGNSSVLRQDGFGGCGYLSGILHRAVPRGPCRCVSGAGVRYEVLGLPRDSSLLWQVRVVPKIDVPGTTRTGRRVRCAVLRRCAAAATVRR